MKTRSHTRNIELALTDIQQLKESIESLKLLQNETMEKKDDKKSFAISVSILALQKRIETFEIQNKLTACLGGDE